jgi:hypothetical protein
VGGVEERETKREREREREGEREILPVLEFWRLSPFPSVTLAYEMVPPTFRTGLPLENTF